jgi:hypothetical protein
MNTAIEKLIGKNVTVTLRSSVAVQLKGVLIQADATFLVLEQNQNEVVIPLTSVLHFLATPVG